MGNKNSNEHNLIEIERTLDSQLFITEEEENEILKHYKEFDKRLDSRFKSVTLYKNRNGVIVARLKHIFKNRRIFKNYYIMYNFRKQIQSKYLLNLYNIYRKKKSNINKNIYILNLLIEYPYNDLKNEVNFRALNTFYFTESELLKILKSCVGYLMDIRKANYNYSFVMNKFSVCLFTKKNKKSFKVKILDFNINSYKYRQTKDLDLNLQENCLQIAYIILEAGLLMNEMLVYDNSNKFRNLRFLVAFSKKYPDKILNQIVDGFLKEKMDLIEAYNLLFKSEDKDEMKYVMKDGRMVLNENYKGVIDKTAKVFIKNFKGFDRVVVD